MIACTLSNRRDIAYSASLVGLEVLLPCTHLTYSDDWQFLSPTLVVRLAHATVPSYDQPTTLTASEVVGILVTPLVGRLPPAPVGQSGPPPASGTMWGHMVPMLVPKHNAISAAQLAPHLLGREYLGHCRVHAPRHGHFPRLVDARGHSGSAASTLWASPSILSQTPR